MMKVASFLLPALLIMSMDAMAENSIAKDVANLRQQHCENFKNTADELIKIEKTDEVYNLLFSIRYAGDGAVNDRLYQKALKIAPQYKDCENAAEWASNISAHLTDKK